MDSNARRAFSLLEVVLAVALASGALLVGLGLLPGLTRQQAAAQQLQIALGLTDAVAAELRRVAGGNPAQLESLAADFTASTSTLRLVAASDGSELRLAVPDDPREQFYLIELHRFPAGSALASETAAAVLEARVTWPYQTGSAEVPASARQRVAFAVTVEP